MSLRFYFALLAVSVWMFGINGQSRGDGGFSFPSLFKRSPPQDFLSSFGGSLTCVYSTKLDCTKKTEYRTIDGSCNHEKVPYVGKSSTPYIRVMPTLYIGGKTPRTKTYFGKLLETPRDLTLKYFAKLEDGTSKSLPDPASTTLTNAAAVFARFIEHDLYHTKLVEGTNCCPTPSSTAGVCNNIVVKEDDPYFKQFRRTCLPKANMVSSPTLTCQDGVSQQVNLNTHYLDLSNIYGSTDTKAKELREGKDGLLKVTLNEKEILLPKADFKDCQTKDKCFLAGDSRVNNDPLLMTMYTIWVRLHNDIAKQVKGINQKYDDEKTFQETRKIVIALYQHIVYSEFLPSLHSTTKLKPTAEFTTWKENSKPQIANYFSIAFTALADTMAQGEFIAGVDEKKAAVTMKLEDAWYNPTKLWLPEGVKHIAEGMLTNKAAGVDRYYTKALYDQYLQKASGQGNDKSALNLQQSRENGINTYYVMTATRINKYDMTTYADLSMLETSAKTKLETLYKYIYDIEFLPGLLGETITSPAVTGPLMADVLEKQFERLRDGDKFFYHHKGIFDENKLAELKKMSMAKIMCKEAAMGKAEPNVFIVDAKNIKQECSALVPNGKLLDICVWAGLGWSEWSETPCTGGFKIQTRQCQFGVDSECVCKGSPVIIKSCPSSIQHILSAEIKAEVEKEYLQYFDKQGRPRPGVHQSSQEIAKNILNHVVPH